jgi:NAD(P)-dependent dehydrogenase (short-subunit alcohol dehydrogenase family)
VKIETATALVTGANRGLGRALAAELLARGATVYAAARRPETLDLPGARPLTLDITDPASVAAAADAAPDVNLLVNNAGLSTGSNLLTGDLGQIRREMDTHYFGTLAVTRAFAPALTANAANGAAVLNILSVLSWLTMPATGAYAAAKSAEWSLTNALRLQLAPQGVRVAGLHVGFIDTDMAARVTAPKISPQAVAQAAVDGLEADLYEILVDDLSRATRANLAGGVPALYPALV